HVEVDVLVVDAEIVALALEPRAERLVRGFVEPGTELDLQGQGDLLDGWAVVQTASRSRSRLRTTPSWNSSGRGTPPTVIRSDCTSSRVEEGSPSSSSRHVWAYLRASSIWPASR